MAVQAQNQFLENPSLHVLCNNSMSHNNNNYSLEWLDSRGELPMDLYRTIQQQQQMMATATATATGCSPLQRLPMGGGSSCSPAASNGVLPTRFAYSMASQMEKQKQEIDMFLCLQSERLRLALQQQSKQHLAALMRRLESKASTVLRQKEEELARASKMTLELEECLRRAEAEGQAWQRAAKENEAMTVALNNALEQVRGNAWLSSAAAADASSSSCDSSPSGPPGGGEEQGKKAAAGGGIGLCSGCGSRDSCMLFLPCMHLCACNLCDGSLDSCPVCGSVKQGSIEVLMS